MILNEEKKTDPFHDQLRKIIVNICHNDYPDVSLDDFMKLDIFDDLALDSIAFITMNEFDIEIPNELMGLSDFRKVYQIESIIRGLLRNKEANK